MIDERTRRVAHRVTEFLKDSGDRLQKTIVFCVDQEHASHMRQALINENSDMVQANNRYVMRITGDDAEGQAELSNFINDTLFPTLKALPDTAQNGRRRVVHDVFEDAYNYMLTECNLHTIVRLPNSVFRPYASIGTNLLFFEKGTPTQDVWFYEHRVPEHQKAYSMTRPIRFEHL